MDGHERNTPPAQSIFDLLECSICLEQLDERNRVLPCQHTFCFKCLAFIVEAKRHLQCPECRSEFPQILLGSLPQNVMLNRILNGLKTRRHSSDASALQSTKDSAKNVSAKLKCEARLNQPCARGLYNYTSMEPGDLHFSKGDVLELLHEIDDNWYEGTLRGKRGAIPKNFLEILIPLPKIEDDSIATPFAKALYSYENKNEPELLSFQAGDIIGVIKRVDDNWLEGILGGQYGIFPLNFVKVNKACEHLVNLSSLTECSSGSVECSSDSTESSSGSDEENELNKQATKQLPSQETSPWIKRGPRSDSTKNMDKPRSSVESSSKRRNTNTVVASQDCATAAASCTSHDEDEKGAARNDVCEDGLKRHTIHLENPVEQRRQSRRALNLPDDINQPRSRLRTRSQGRRGSGNLPQETAVFANAIIANRLRNSNSQSDNTCRRNYSAPLLIPPSRSRYTTSVSNRSAEQLINNSPIDVTTLGFCVGEIYISLFTYSPSQDDELALIQGEQYCVVEKHLDGWYRGYHVRSRRHGVFPGNYVKLKSDVTPQMIQAMKSNRNSVGFGSNPSSPIHDETFEFPSVRCESSNPRLSEQLSIKPAKSSLFKKLKKKSKRHKPQPGSSNQDSSTTLPTATTHSSVSQTHSLPIATVPSTDSQTNTSFPQPQPPPSYQSSVTCLRNLRPCPVVPCEPPPPYTPIDTHTTTIDVNTRVTTTTSPTANILPVSEEKFRVIHPYPPSHNSELPLRLNDIIYVTQKRLDGWFKGRSERTGDVGIFPSIFVEPLNDE